MRVAQITEVARGILRLLARLRTDDGVQKANVGDGQLGQDAHPVTGAGAEDFGGAAAGDGDFDAAGATDNG